MSAAKRLAGGIVSFDPLVTYSSGGKPRDLGIAGLYPEYFRNRHALHFIALPRAVETFRIDALVADFRRLQIELTDNLLVVVANDDYQNYQLSRAGIVSMPASHLALIDETVFRPAPPPPGEPMFDAVYNARLDPPKRHELAAGVDRLMLIYSQSGDGSEDLRRVNGLLPNAFYANKAVTGEDFRWMRSEKVAELLTRARVGLCLSAVEGAMSASMEYLLCGLCVVSTASVGGRERYLMPPYATIVEPDPAAVANAVREMVARDIPKAAVRDHIGRIVTFERHHFLKAANRIAHQHFGIDRLFSSVEPIARYANTWRPADEVIAPLAALSSPTTVRSAPPVADATPAEQRTVAFILARGRSGTHLLRSFLSQHPQIEVINEVFNQDLARRLPHNFNDFLVSYMAANPEWRMSGEQADAIISAYFEHLAKSAERRIVAVDVKHDQLRLLDWPSITLRAIPRLLDFIAGKDNPIIRVVRNDVLAQHASLLLAYATGQWQLPKSKGEQAPVARSIRLQPRSVLGMLRDWRATEDAIDGWLHKRPNTITVTYETMLDGDRLADEPRKSIGELLGVELAPEAVAGTVKIAPPLRDYVENLDEVLDSLRDTPFAWLIDLHRPA